MTVTERRYRSVPTAVCLATRFNLDRTRSEALKVAKVKTLFYYVTVRKGCCGLLTSLRLRTFPSKHRDLTRLAVVLVDKPLAKHWYANRRVNWDGVARRTCLARSARVRR